jgi:putative endonuclease
MMEKAMAEKRPVVYIMASKRNGTLYTGVTSDLGLRVSQHKTGLVEGFTRKYGVHMLVYYERHDEMRSAIIREKQIKKWNRAWKLKLIERENPEWRDLSDELQWHWIPACAGMTEAAVAVGGNDRACGHLRKSSQKPGVRTAPSLRSQATWAGGAQAGVHGHFEGIATEEACGEEQDFEILDFAGPRVHPHDHVIAKLFGFLFRVGRTLVNIQDIPFTVISESQFRFHRRSFSDPCRAM